MASDTPSYQLVAGPELLADHNIELRRYETALVASVRVKSDSWRSAANAAFQPLANYIFGQNQRNEKIGMTTPVTTHQIETPTGEIAFEVRFFMPNRYEMDSLPQPQNGYIQLTKLEEVTFAAIRFNGAANGAGATQNFAKHETKLRTILGQAGLTPQSEAHYAVYNGPWTPNLLRRNEVLIAITAP